MDEYQTMVQSAPVRITGLVCEYQTNPLGIEAVHPRLSWKMTSIRRGARQTAYRIQVAETPDHLQNERELLWDTGRVESNQSVHVQYEGSPLRSRQRVWWRVQVWDELGQNASSVPAWWEMGLLNRSDWQARWVGSPLVGGARTTVPVPYLRTTFNINKPVLQARLYVTALGLYECYLNGQQVGNEIFTPGWTDYTRRVQYQVYDVSDLLGEGENALGALLGDGWYCGFVGWYGRQNYGDRPKLLAQLEILHPDGRTTMITSDDHWKTSAGSILESDFQMGESYDARREPVGWAKPGFDAAGWQNVIAFEDPGIQYAARRGPAVRKIQEIYPVTEPVKIPEWPAPRWIFDLGQNMVGWVRLKVSGAAGTTVALRFAEVLDPDGRLYTANLRSARSIDYYTLKGGGEEVFEPHFTFHGFRYVEISGLPGQLTRDAITGIVIHSDMEVTGAFECSDPLLNQLQHNIQWGQRGNFVDVPTDCPQRDERLGWTGDAQVFIRTAAFNMNVASFFTKWVQDLEDSQSTAGQIPPVAPNINMKIEPFDGGPAWADAFTICPWTIYQVFGDREILAGHYPAIKKYVDHLESMSLNLIRCHPDSHYQDGDWEGFGDWLSINAETPKDIIGTAFLAYSAELVAKMAAVLGQEDDQTHYRKLAEDTRQAFLHRFVTGDGLVAGNTQTAYVLALHFGLLDENQRASAVRELVRDIQRRGNHLSTGFVGAPYLMHVLTNANRNDMAYTLLNQKSWPSWLYPVTQGATTIWERWDGWTQDKGFQDPGMNSFNHYAYGSIGDWMYSVVAGINCDPQQPGFRHIHLHPQPGGGLSFARASFESMYGLISSAWRVQDDIFTWEVTVPPNTTATLTFPAAPGTAVLEGGRVIEQVEGIAAVKDTVLPTYTAVPGVYSFALPAEAVHFD